MHPAFSVISFTTLLGAAQGLITTLGVLTLLAVDVPSLFAMLLISIVMLIVSLGASFLHLGHPERAWRAMMMWRTSWLSREVLVLPAFIGLTCLWALLEFMGQRSPVLIVVILVVSIALWICTAMIYACIKFIQVAELASRCDDADDVPGFERGRGVLFNHFSVAGCG
jgi:DMSO reductase anchor subunit